MAAAATAPARLNRPRRASSSAARASSLAFDRGEGKVDVDGVPWPARLEAMAPVPAPGERVRILAADGIVVWVKPV